MCVADLPSKPDPLSSVAGLPSKTTKKTIEMEKKNCFVNGLSVDLIYMSRSSHAREI